MTRNSKKLVYGKGLKGDGAAKVNGKHTKAYTTWQDMLKRCYSPRFQKLRPTYISCSVCNDWLYYPNFKKWHDANYVDGYELDKDLLVNENKEYNPGNCIFVPQSINSLFIEHGRARGLYPLGACFNKTVGKFVAQMRVDGKLQHLGFFDNADEAHNTYIKAKKANVIRMANVWKEKIQPKLYEALVRKANELT